MNILKSLKFRIFDNLWTTLGGGTVGGGIVAIIIGKLEEMTGCHFSTAFANVDWGQLFGFVAMQVFGMLVTDGNKVVPNDKTKDGSV